MINPKEEFLRNKAFHFLKSIPKDTKGNWGVMSVQHMIEHLADAFKNANGKDSYEGILTPDENIDRFQKFVMSDKPFKENTKNVLLPDTPLPLRFNNIQDAYAELETEINDFFIVFKNEPNKIIRNPFFGDLDYDHWVSLLHKHVVHHLTQFGADLNIMD